MRIALVSPYDYAYPGGVMVHIAHLEEHLSRLGHYVRVIAPSSIPQEMLEKSSVLVVGKPLPIPASGSIARITLSLGLARPVKAILERERFDIVHLHEPLIPALPLTVLRLSTAINVGTFHAFSGRSLAYRLGRPLLYRWFRRLHGRIAVSPPALQFINRYFPSDYQIIPNGIDFKHFAAEAPPLADFQDGKLNILFVGRLEKRKGVNYLLEAYARLKSQQPSLRLIVVGPGDGLLAHYQQWVRRAGVADVVFTGYVPDSELPRYYRTADLFCAPATGQESFGIVLLEAMAAAKPMVVSSIEGYSHLIRDGEEGFLVPAKDTVALAAALGRLIQDAPLRRAMGARGQLRAREYSWPQVAQQVEAFYRELLAQQAAHPSLVLHPEQEETAPVEGIPALLSPQLPAQGKS